MDYTLNFMLCCVLCAMVQNIDAVAEKNLYIESSNNLTIACAQTKENLLRVTVIEGEPFELPVKLNRSRYFIDHILCRYNSTDLETTLHNNIISINKIKSNMAGVWSCRILTDKDGQTQPQITYEDKKYAVAYCFVRAHIRSNETLQRLLVNNMIIRTEVMPVTDIDIDNYAEYNFLEGDTVDVSCIPRDNVDKTLEASITLHYNYTANLDEAFNEQMSRGNKNGFGFRTKLQSRHNNSILICLSIDDTKDYAKIKMKFVLQDPKVVYSHLSINGLTSRMRVDQPNGFKVYDSDYNYLFFKNEELNIVCDTIKSEMHVGFSEQSCEKQNITSESNNFKSPLTTRHCYKCKNGTIVEDISFSVTPLSLEFQETVKLTVDLPPNNIVMEWYKYGDPNDRQSWIYYEFDEGDIVTLKCSYLILPNVSAMPEISLTLNNTSVSSGKSITLTSAYDKIDFMCKVTEQQDTRTPQIETLYKQITVTFHMKVTTTTPDSLTTEITKSPGFDGNTDNTNNPESNASTGGDESADFPAWALALVGILLCTILVCVTIAVCRMRKRNQKPEPDRNYEQYQEHSNDGLIPPYPQQWSRPEEQNYCDPADFRSDNTVYAEPVRGPDDPYAVPIPKSQRPSKLGRDNPEPAYAELNLPSNKSIYSNPGASQYATLKDLYTEVLPKSERNKNQNSYGNIFPDSRYVNSGNPEYVEPTYCLPHKK